MAQPLWAPNPPAEWLVLLALCHKAGDMCDSGVYGLDLGSSSVTLGTQLLLSEPQFLQL